MAEAKPKMCAKFVLDNSHAPMAIEGNNYRIKLYVQGAPEDTHAVTYKLHESYYNRLREVRDGPAFEEEITSYGDYPVQAVIRRKKQAEVISEKLSTLLERSYKDDPSPQIKQAIEQIREN